MRYLFAFFFIGFTLAAGAQTRMVKKIQLAYERLAIDAQMAYASASLTVLDAETGALVFSKNGSQGLAPASTLKTVTSATAFHLLGADFAFETSLAYTGTLSPNGILNGDVVILGNGDPSLGSWRYEQTKTELILKNWLNAIKKLGIKSITGKIIGDDRVFGTQIIPDGWIWQDIGNYYGGGASALSWRENQFDVYLKPGAKVGDPVSVQRVFPAMPYLKLVNEVSTGVAGSGDKVFAYAAPYSDLIYLRGTYAIDLAKPVSPSIPDPAFDAAFRLADTLKTSGIAVQQGFTTWRRLTLDPAWTAGEYHIISSSRSPNLNELVYWFNRKSINLYGENLLKTFALKQGKPAESGEGAQVLKAFWKQKLGIDPNSINITDGSGLSPADRITTLTMARILQSVRKEPWFNAYYESLPVYNDMKMKSGSIADVLAYAGYQTNAAGHKLVFSFIINNYNGSTSAIRQKMFKVLDELK
ncbi:MAG: D-alanyl-D-alanine carboxypeptidase/D-alanyl-D-alanine-endopeptidase [Sphingobacteriaceae bacterium]